MKNLPGLFVVIVLLILSSNASAQKTYCNPINLDYGYCPIPIKIIKSE